MANKTLLLSVIALISAIIPSNAQKRDTLRYSNSYLDTVVVAKKFLVNDYFTVGVEYGVSYNDALFNPSYETTRQFNPGYMGIFFTHYEKMFGRMPYFGLKAGIVKATEGYMFKADEETGLAMQIYTWGELGIDGTKGQIGERVEVIELPLMAMGHFDWPHFKGQIEAGIYGGYRNKIERFGREGITPSEQFNFRDFEYRYDYGLMGGAGLGLVFAPVELMVNARVRYSWQSFMKPDYMSEYYYRFAYPFDIMLTAGLYIELGRRTGRSRSELKKEAYNIVFGE